MSDCKGLRRAVVLAPECERLVFAVDAAGHLVQGLTRVKGAARAGAASARGSPGVLPRAIVLAAASARRPA